MYSGHMWAPVVILPVYKEIKTSFYSVKILVVSVLLISVGIQFIYC